MICAISSINYLRLHNWGMRMEGMGNKIHWYLLYIDGFDSHWVSSHNNPMKSYCYYTHFTDVGPEAQQDSVIG